MPSFIKQSFVFLFLYCRLVVAQENTNPNNEENPFENEISCYGLPYGAIGFVSHLLTYYTMAALAFEKTPLMPWRDLNNGVQNLPLAITKLIFTTIPSIATIIHCGSTW
jgi:hypothetical protein